MSEAAPMEAAIRDLFRRYEDGFNAGLAGGDAAGMADLYAEAFVGSSPTGVMAGQNGEALTQAMAAGFAHYRDSGARRFAFENLAMQTIDAMHAIVPVDWIAHYDKDGREVQLAFTVTYLVRVSDGRARVFGWISGDEQAALREHGLA